MKIKLNKAIVNYIVPLIILMGVSSALFYQAAQISTAHAHNEYTFYSLTKGLNDYYNFNTPWKTRLFSNALAAVDARLSDSILYRVQVPFIQSPLELTIALWTTGWFLLIGLMFVVVARNRATFYIFGTYAALSFGYMPRLATRIYPWDMPALFIFTLFLILLIRDQLKWLYLLVPLGTGFKETTLLLPLAFLFTDESWKNRLLKAGIAGLLGVAVKVAIDAYVRNPIFWTMRTAGQGPDAASYFFGNLANLGNIYAWLLNAGTLLAFLILPMFNKKMQALKLIGLLFILGNFLFGVLFEYRIWFEMIPFALYGIEIASYGNSALAAPEPSL